MGFVRSTYSEGNESLLPRIGIESLNDHNVSLYIQTKTKQTKQLTRRISTAPRMYMAPAKVVPK